MKKLLILLTLTLPFNLYALPNSLNEYISSNPTWKTDISSKSFMATRCSIVNIISSERVSEDTRPESKSLSEGFKTFSAIFALYSDTLFTMGGGSKDNFKDRALHWAKLYGEEAVSNINNYNEMTRGDFGQDLLFCNQIMYKFVEKDIKNIAN